MKLNLGCGQDYREGYVNVDIYPQNDYHFDLNELPWPWHAGAAEEILMLDFLEHFPYAKTDLILQEVWRVLEVGGFVDIQVPDFYHCAMAACCQYSMYKCNFCGGHVYSSGCADCHKTRHEIAQAAIHRLYGGQDIEGNWHYTAFTQETLERKLSDVGFGKFEHLEEDYQWANWNFKTRAFKLPSDPWGE